MEQALMKSGAWIVRLTICAWLSTVMSMGVAQAAMVSFTLDNIFLDDGEQITGAFDWTYDVGDFEGGTGVFTALDIPWTSFSLAGGDLNIGIQTDSIEISGTGNFHDIGLDITLFPLSPLTPTQSISINTATSIFECCGNGFHDGVFVSGSISLAVASVPIPASIWLFGTGLLGLIGMARKKNA